MTARLSILEKCRAYRAGDARRGGVRLSETEALWLEGVLARLLTADERLELRRRVDLATREKLGDLGQVERMERQLDRSIEDALMRAAA